MRTTLELRAPAGVSQPDHADGVRRRRWLRRWAAAVAVLGWLCAVGHGFDRLLAHQAAAGAHGAAPAEFPRKSRLVRAADRATLVMIVHPRCPCTRASIRELARLMPKLGGAVAPAFVVAVPGTGEMDAQTSLAWQLASEVPGAQLLADPGGQEARRFGALTSGHVLVYDAQGALRFSGGITPGRGHEGPSAGADALARSLEPRGDTLSAKVFGCELFDPG